MQPKNFDKINERRTKHQRFYQSKEWQRTRLYVLAIEPVCRICASTGLTTIATVVDHIVSLTDDYSKRLDIDNLQSLCDRCHNIKSKQEQIEYIRREREVKTTIRMNELNQF